MTRFAVLASCVALVSGCRLSLEDDAPSGPVDASLVDAPISPTCMEALTHSDLAFIETKIFNLSCTFSGCHNGANTDAGRLDLRPIGTGTPPAPGAAAELVNVDSVISPTYKYVVPGQPNQSHLLMMIQHIPPAMMSPPTVPPDPQVGYMPQNAGGRPICVEKRDAIQRWIMAGAPAT